jgi:hypothetical protein
MDASVDLGSMSKETYTALAQREVVIDDKGTTGDTSDDTTNGII